MPNFSVQTEHLQFRYSSRKLILDDVSLEVTEGSIYGFVGPNGAGKTTTLRLLLGLLRCQHGKISVFGKKLEANRIAILRLVGSLIEGPSLYEHLTARENLQLMSLVYRTGRDRIAEVLQLVGLSEAADQRAGEFSLGMKQRLAIGIALVHRPRLLILDEPTNGLDPSGIVAMREFLRTLNEQFGITILVSSHLLSEVERLATHVGVLHQGKLLFQGPLEELRLRAGMSVGVWLSTNNNERAQMLLREGNIAAVPASIVQGRLRIDCSSRSEIASINRHLVMAGIEVHAIESQDNSLEDIFLDMVSRYERN
jgi:ABC-2 type transport system ATP-binding protein